MNITVINVRAVLIGAAVDIGGTTFVASALVPMWLRAAISGGADPMAAYAGLGSSSAFLATGLILGVAFNFLGGVTAAWLARKNHVLNGFLTSIPCIAMGGFQALSPLGNPSPNWYTFAGTVLAMLGAFVGGYFAKSRFA